MATEPKTMTEDMMVDLFEDDDEFEDFEISEGLSPENRWHPGQPSEEDAMERNEEADSHPTEVEVYCKPIVDMTFDSLEDAWRFWKRHSRRMGFSVRKEKKNTSKIDKRVTNAIFTCSKYGVRKFDKRRVNSKHRPETKTNCQVHINIVLDREVGKYEIKRFVEEHNHDLEPPVTIHKLRAHKPISIFDGELIVMRHKACLTPSQACKSTSIDAAGSSPIGYTSEDHKIYLQHQRQKNMEYGALGIILQYFDSQTLKDPLFYHSEQCDKDELVTNIFWCDGRMQLDYETFGDVVTFDTIYGINKELRPVVVFTGFNHHRQMVIFGAALMYDEKIESFVWVFETFLKIHKNKKPRTLFSDQIGAISNAMSLVMPETYHGLCAWHISQNAKKHMSNYNKGNSSFWGAFNNCMFNIMDLAEFERSWTQMVEELDLKNNKWIHDLYDLRMKWAKCFMKYALTLGIRSTQLSANLNRDLKNHLKCDVNIVEFFEQFDEVLKQKRQNEADAEFDGRQKLPLLANEHSLILQQVAKIYTHNVFERFQKEFNLAVGALTCQQGEMDNEFIVGMHDDYRRTCKVYFDKSTEHSTCSCRKFEVEGILCCHILKVFAVYDVFKIPGKYILTRWTREAKNGILYNVGVIEDEGDLQWNQRMNSICLRIIHHSMSSKELRKETGKCLVELYEKVCGVRKM